MRKLLYVAVLAFLCGLASAQGAYIGPGAYVGPNGYLGATPAAAAIITNVAGETSQAFGGIGGGGTKSVTVTAVLGDLIHGTCLTVYTSGTSNSVVTVTNGDTVNVVDQTGATGTTNYVNFWIKVATGGSDTITCTGNANSNYMDFEIDGWHSTTGWPASPVDGTNHTISSSSCNLTVGPTSQAVEIAIGNCSGGTVVNQGAPFTQLVLFDGGNLVSYDITSVTGSPNFNPSNAFVTVAALAAFKPN